MSTSESTDTGLEKISGELTIYTATDTKQRWLEMSKRYRHMQLDLGDVTELDCAGVQLLLALKKQLLNHDGSLVLKNHSDAVIDIFELLGLADYFTDPLVLCANRGV
jgi:anti-sigma B factor antagonist